MKPVPLSEAPASAAPPGKPATSYRWRICALLFAATTINYVDRQVLGVLAPLLQVQLGWSELEYGYIVTAFQSAYALGLLVAGGAIDRLGSRLGYAIAIAVWSIAAMAHSLVRTTLGFGALRFLLGLGEAGNFPAAIKTVAEWFPQRERSFATGLFNSGSNIGAILAPIMAPWVALRFGWQWAFVVTGVFSAMWIAAWLTIYRKPEQHPSVSATELSYIQSGREEPAQRVPWRDLLPLRQTWAFTAGKFITDPVWWFFLSWLPKFFNSEHGLTLTELGLPLVVIYLTADVGSIGGGWLASWFMRRGFAPGKARKAAMLCCALSVVPVVFAPFVSNLWGAVALVSIAAAAHQGWSANLFTLTSDMFPRRAVASVVGIGGFAGAVGGMLIATFTGLLLEFTGSYIPVFLMASSAYLVALGVIHFLVPRLAPAHL